MAQTCYLEDCDGIHHAQGLCAIHYGRQRKKALRDGAWESVMVDAHHFRRRILHFRKEGYTFPMIAAVTGIEKDTLSRALLKSRQTVLEDNMDKLLRTPLVPLWQLWKQDIGENYPVPQYLATRRVRALMSLGWSVKDIAREAGVVPRTIQRVYLEKTETIMRDNLVQIDQAFRKLSIHKPPPHYHHTEMDKFRHWPVPFEWDSGELDHPNGARMAERRAAIRFRQQQAEGLVQAS